MRFRSFPVSIAVFIALACFAFVFDDVLLSPVPSFIVFVLFFTYVVFTRPTFVLRYLYVFFIVTSNIVGVYVCETIGLPLDELGVYSSYAGSLSLLGFAQLLFLLVLLYFDLTDNKSFLDVVANVKDGKWIDIAVNACVILAACLFALAVTHSSFSVGVDRFLYRELGPVQAMVSRLVLFAKNLIPVGVIAYASGIKKKAALFFILYGSSAFLIGEKFGLFMLMASVFFLGMITTIKLIDLRVLRRYALAALGLLVLLVGLVFVHNHFVYGYSFSDNVDYLERRLAQQGQLWWRTYQVQQDRQPHPLEFQGEIDTWFGGDADPYSGDYGVYKIMKLCVANSALFYRKLDNNSSYTYSTQASMYYYFGAGAVLLFSVASAIAYAVLVRLFAESLARHSLIESILLMRLLILAHGLLTQSNFLELFDWKIAIYVAGYLLVRMIARGRRDVFAGKSGIVIWPAR